MAENNDNAAKNAPASAAKRSDKKKTSIMDMRQNDFVADAMQRAVDATSDFPAIPAAIANQISKTLDALAKSKYPQSDEENGGRRYPNIEKIIARRDLDIDAAQFDLGNAKRPALAAFETQKDVWSSALKKYDFALTSAEADLRTAVKQAVNDYNERVNPDSERHNAFLYYTMRSAVAEALTDYEKLAGTAAGTLAAAAGEVLSAYATFAATISVAQSTFLSGEAAAELSFWSSVEQVRDG